MTGNTHTRARRALVIGASMAGLFATALLRRRGWDVDVYERNPAELFGRGAGITTHGDLLRLLELCGASLQDLGITVHERIALDRSGAVIDRIPFEQVVTSWDRLHQIMRAAIPAASHHLGHGLVAVDQDEGGLVATFANGRTERADLLVGADGWRSTVRGLVAPEVQPIYAGYVIWRGVAYERDIAPSARAAIFDRFAFYVPPHNKVIGYPIAGPDNDLRVGQRRYNFVWYRPLPPERLPDMLRGEDGRRYDLSIPPPQVRSHLVGELRREADAFLPGPFSEVLRQVERPFFTPIYDHVSPRMAFGRVALIGDAAAVGRPHIGMGVAKAAADAEALADALAHPDAEIEAGLARFEATRLPVAAKSVARGRQLGAYMLAEAGHDGDSADAVEFHSVRGILRNTASSAFLDVA